MVFLIFSYFIVNLYLGIAVALTNPVLGDNFGLDVKYDSYVFVGSLGFFAAGAPLV